MICIGTYGISFISYLTNSYLLYETDEHHVQSQIFSHGGVVLFQHVQDDTIHYLHFTLRCGSYNLMTTKLYEGKIYKKITKLWID